MHRAIEGGAIRWSGLSEAPPRWAVVTVKTCVVGVLALPLATLIWLIVSPLLTAEAAVLAPIAFGVSVGLGATFLGAIAFLTTTYPPVPTASRR